MDELNLTQQQIAEKVGRLLAESALKDEIKDGLLQNIENMPDYLLIKLMNALEAESDEMDKAIAEVELAIRERNGAWKKTEDDQKAAADTIADTWIQKLS